VSAGIFIKRFRLMDYGVERQCDATCGGFFCAAVTRTGADDVDEESLFSVAVAGIAVVFSIVTIVADGILQRIIGIGRVALGTRLVATAIGEVEDVHSVSVWFGFRVVRVHGLRSGTIGHDGGWG